MSQTLVVAEAGSCHDGKLDAMGEMIRVAKNAGADVCKFQWTSSPERLAARRHAEEYLWAYRTIAFPRDWLTDLKNQCDAADIEFMCTVYLPEDVPLIAPLVQRFKVASFEALDLEFLRAHAGYAHATLGHHEKEAIVSTGMLTEPEITLIRNEQYASPSSLPPIRFLHCVAAYPAPLNELNLHHLRTREYAGFSDHTGFAWTGALAVAAGASILEVHFRLDSTSPQNPDYGHSLGPAQLKEYIANVRLTEAAFGGGGKGVTPSEERWAKYRVRA